MTTELKNDIWRLEMTVGGRRAKYASLIPHDLNYFHHHFIGKPMAEDWSPPPIVAEGKTKKLPDFVIWMSKAPVVSEKAKNALQDVLGSTVQFLPFHDLRDKPYYAMNVLHIENGLLDAPRSEIRHGGIIRASFYRPLPNKLPPIFKHLVPSGEVDSSIFVTRAFAMIAIEHKLTGIALADPMADSFKFIIAGKDENTVPGIVG